MSLQTRNDLTAGYVRAILDYEPETGLFKWKYRAERPKEWNTRRAGKPAGGRNGPDSPVMVIRIDDNLYCLHRLAWLYMTGEWPKGEIDHINGNPTDNRFKNLRDTTHSQNMQNRSTPSNNSSGFVGVRYRAHHKKWEARVYRDKICVWHAYFASAQEAANARNIALEEVHGDFAPKRPERRSHYKWKKPAPKETGHAAIAALHEPDD